MTFIVCYYSEILGGYDKFEQFYLLVSELYLKLEEYLSFLPEDVLGFETGHLDLDFHLVGERLEGLNLVDVVKMGQKGAIVGLGLNEDKFHAVVEVLIGYFFVFGVVLEVLADFQVKIGGNYAHS